MRTIIGSLLIIASLVVFGVRIYQKETFKKNVSGYLKRAADANTIDELVFDKSVAVAHLLNRVESGIPKFENLDQKFKNNIESILMNEKKGEKLKEKMTGASLEEIAKNVSATVQTATNAKLDNTNIDGIGSEPAVVGTAFGLEANGISKPVVGETGVFVVRLKSMTPAPLPDNFDAQKNEITNRLRMPGGGATDRAFRTLTELSGLKDNREKVNILGN